ncbi:MAG: hypothetical protein OXU31_05295 [Gammaproteobacteria bacterium]|nr:hypothetical protein [Gammaproteobacteria bacterium]MDD9799873.1 hypothetical protein [Gammaproteobacteria bacterium]MDD9815381.1 hypothetical protein [Gammaproteobacteria bacterium]MDD9850512.1 hypothetical protein [Gammaproteobacteria bacterium]MDD9871066.1 hypothetical protein [Gammaproteobacteria bacterium]
MYEYEKDLRVPDIPKPGEDFEQNMDEHALKTAARITVTPLETLAIQQDIHFLKMLLQEFMDLRHNSGTEPRQKEMLIQKLNQIRRHAERTEQLARWTLANIQRRDNAAKTATKILKTLK